MNIKRLLGERLTAKEIALVPSSYDVVGDILIFASFPKDLIKKQGYIGQCFLESLVHVKVVCKKSKSYSGEFRTPRLTIIAGEKRKETVYKENNIVLKLDVEKCYFSPRLSNERLRLARLVKDGEEILVMFSGVAPYPLVIAKNSRPKSVYGIEKNPIACKYAEQNVILNKAKNITLFCGDVLKILPKIRRKFDRVLMPLPRDAQDFLGTAIPRLKKGGIIHFYDFLNESEFDKAKAKVIGACKKKKRHCEILGIVKCGQYSPRTFRICVDAKIT